MCVKHSSCMLLVKSLKSNIQQIIFFENIFYGTNFSNINFLSLTRWTIVSFWTFNRVIYNNDASRVVTIIATGTHLTIWLASQILIKSTRTDSRSGCSFFTVMANSAQEWCISYLPLGTIISSRTISYKINTWNISSSYKYTWWEPCCRYK